MSKRSFPLGLVPAFVCLLAAVLASGCAGGGSADPYSRRYTAVDINPNPAILNSAIVKGTNLTNLRLENVVVKDATFYNTSAQAAYFKNVVFDNCRFINAKFDRSVLENVVFRGGILTCEDDQHNYARRTQFTNSRFTNLILDGTYLENALFNGSDGSIGIRNAHYIVAAQPLITGSNMHLVLNGSIFRHMTLAEVTGASTVSAANCRFEYVTFGNSTFTRADFSKNVVLGGSLYQEKKRPARSRRR